jgi:hypothetical protein
MVIINMIDFSSSLSTTAGVRSSVGMVGVGDLHALLEGALGQQAACQLRFQFEEEIKGCWCERREYVSWENFVMPFSTANY